MRTIRTKVYKFDELTQTAKDTVIQKLSDINVDYDWWESTYEDAKNAGLQINSFDIDRGSYCKGEFIQDADYCAEKILQEHGNTCETYKTAANYMEERSKLNIDEQEDELSDLDSEFLKSICEDYRIMLSNEYDYLTSEKAIIETIQANEYEFTADGRRF